MNKTLLFILTMISFIITDSSAQKKQNTIDEVIWVVGDQAILRSEVEQAILEAQQSGVEISGNPYCVIPEQMAIDKLYLHQAQLDSINANESTVASQVEARLEFYISRIGSKEKMEATFKMSTAELRDKLQEIIRNQMIIQEEQRKLVENLKSTPADVRRFFNKMAPDSIPTVPTQVELQIISFEPPVSINEINRIKEQLRDFSERVNSGKSDFSTLARFYSEDPESAKRGGELGFMGRGQLTPEFASVAFNLIDSKKVSRIVETEFGYHIIQLIEKRGDLINCRQILLKPHISYDEKQKAIHVLDSLANLIRENKMTFEEAVINFSQDKNSAMNAGLMLNEKTGTSKFEYQDLPPEVGKTAYSMNVGEVSKPFIMMNTRTNKEMVAVVKLKSKTETHKANLADDFQLLKTLYETKLKENFLRNWIIRKQKETYINIDPEWQNCTFQYPGWIKK